MSTRRYWLIGLVAVMVLFVGQLASADQAAAQTVVTHKVFLSSPSNGTVQGISYTDEDILQFDEVTGLFTLFFDGSAAGLPASTDIDALDVEALFISMSFDNPVAVPGLGTVDDSDVVQRSRTTGVWSLAVDGSAVGLTTNGEDVDAYSFLSDRGHRMSTGANFNVQGPDGLGLTGTDEDIFSLFTDSQPDMQMILDGSAHGLAKEDVTGVAFTIDPVEFDFDLFVTTQDGFNIGGVKGAGGDILKCDGDAVAGGCQFSVIFDASAHGFAKVDGMDVQQIRS